MNSSRFYADYNVHKDYAVPELKSKHIGQFDREIWIPALCQPVMSYLEVGCGTGLFLQYLRYKGVENFLGLDQDPHLSDVMTAEIRAHFQVATIEEFLKNEGESHAYDRILLFDVLEHFTYEGGADLLNDLSDSLNTGGRIIIKLPNMASPWGGQYQFGDLTHQAAYNPTSIRQLASATGYQVMKIYPNRTGSPVRQFLDPVFHGVLSRILMTPPEVWTANFYAILARADDQS